MLVYQRMALIFLVWSFSLFDRRLDLPSHLGFLRVTVTQIYRLQVFWDLICWLIFCLDDRANVCLVLVATLHRFKCAGLYASEYGVGNMCMFFPRWMEIWISITTNGYKLPAILLLRLPWHHIQIPSSTSKLGYAVTGGLWAAAALLSFMVAICKSLPFLYTSVQVGICHSHSCCVTTPHPTPPLYIYTQVTWTCYQRSIKSIFRMTSTCYQRSIKSVFQGTSTCYQRSIKSVCPSTATCYQRSIKSVFRVTSTCYQSSIKSVFQGTSTC